MKQEEIIIGGQREFSGEEKLKITSEAQKELMELAGAENENAMFEWIQKYSPRFRTLIDQDDSLLGRLASESTHDETLEEIKQKLYH